MVALSTNQQTQEARWVRFRAFVLILNATISTSPRAYLLLIGSAVSKYKRSNKVQQPSEEAESHVLPVSPTFPTPVKPPPEAPPKEQFLQPTLPPTGASSNLEEEQVENSAQSLAVVPDSWPPTELSLEVAVPEVAHLCADNQDNSDTVDQSNTVLAFDAPDAPSDTVCQPEVSDSPVPALEDRLEALSSDEEEDEKSLIVLAPTTVKPNKETAKPKGDAPTSTTAGRSVETRAQVVDPNEDSGDWDALAALEVAPYAPVVASSSTQPAPFRVDNNAEDAQARPPSDVAPDNEWARFGGALAIGGAADDGSLPALSCSSCGFSVLRFRNCRWSSSGGNDYMHFRNYNGHSLNLPKLTAELRRCPRGGAAYACQCSWQSVTQRKPLDALGTDPGTEGGAANGSLRWHKAKPPPKAA